MDGSTSGLLLVVAALATNQLVMRLPALYRHDTVFWALEGFICTFGGYLLWRGVPGLDGFPIVSWVVGLMFFLHAAQNIRVRQSRRRKLAQALAEERRARAAAIQASLVEADDAVDEPAEDGVSEPSDGEGAEAPSADAPRPPEA